MKPLGTSVIVRPLYDPERVETGLSPGCEGLYMPDSGKNPMSQQGVVEGVGEEQKYLEVGDHIIYHPFVQSPFRWNGKEYLHVEARHIVGRLNNFGKLLTFPHDVVIKPDFTPEAGRPAKRGSIYIPNQVFRTEVPCSGVVESVGDAVTLVSVGQRVLFPPDAGDEIGLKEVVYVLPEKTILGILETELPVTVMVTTNWR